MENLSTEEEPGTVMTSKLEAARLTSAEEDRLARKAAWIAESRAEVLRRRQFRERRMTDILPELPWERILKKLDPREKELMSRMNLLWRDLLKTERTQFLFEKIFRMLHSRLSRNDFLNLRSVCKEWKRSLENCLQDKVIYSPGLYLEGSTDDPGTCFLEMKLLSDHRRVARINEQISNNQASFFTGFKLCLGFSGSHEEDAAALLHYKYWTAVKALLHKQGELIQEVQITIDKDLFMETVYDQVRTLVELMPNLRYLAIDGDVNEDDPTMMPDNGYYDDLEEFIRRGQPLPELPHLEGLIFREIPPPIVTALLRKSSPSLKVLSITEFYGSPNASCAEDISFPNLKRLYHSTEYSTFLIQPSMTSTGNWPNLKELSLMYPNVDDKTEIRSLFQVLSSFGGSLQDLCLFLEKSSGPILRLEEEELKMLSLDLPQLQQFTLSVSRINLKTVDFCLPMRALKKLVVFYTKHVSSIEKKKKFEEEEEDKHSASKSTDDTSVIKFASCINRLYDSNIWKLLPGLREVIVVVIKRLKKKEGNTPTTVEEVIKSRRETKSIKRKIYTRAGYNKFLKDFIPASSSSSSSDDGGGGTQRLL